VKCSLDTESTPIGCRGPIVQWTECATWRNRNLLLQLFNCIVVRTGTTLTLAYTCAYACHASIPSGGRHPGRRSIVGRRWSRRLMEELVECVVGKLLVYTIIVDWSSALVVLLAHQTSTLSDLWQKMCWNPAGTYVYRYIVFWCLWYRCSEIFCICFAYICYYVLSAIFVSISINFHHLQLIILYLHWCIRRWGSFRRSMWVVPAPIFREPTRLQWKWFPQ